jgi:alpha-ribazole phosphatase
MPDSTTSETRLWLLRHPEPESRATGRCYGSLDLSLSDKGIRQARAVAQTMAGEPLAAIYSSPRQRCQQAASILAEGRNCPVETADAFRELDFGEFEGRTYDEIAAACPDLYRQWMETPTKVQFPGGESYCDLRMRVVAAAGELRTRFAGQSIALVTHAGVIRVLLAEALRMRAEDIFRISQRYASLNLIRYLGEFPVVDRMNAEATPALPD